MIWTRSNKWHLFAVQLHVELPSGRLRDLLACMQAKQTTGIKSGHNDTLVRSSFICESSDAEEQCSLGRERRAGCRMFDLKRGMTSNASQPRLEMIFSFALQQVRSRAAPARLTTRELRRDYSCEAGIRGKRVNRLQYFPNS